MFVKEDVYGGETRKNFWKERGTGDVKLLRFVSVIFGFVISCGFLSYPLLLQTQRVGQDSTVDETGKNAQDLRKPPS